MKSKKVRTRKLPKPISNKKLLSQLRRKCLKIWSDKVKERDGRKCVFCGSTEKVNAHHIESFKNCKPLRYELRNGISLCPKHHKFGMESAHRSFVFMYLILVENRKEDIDWLSKHRYDEITFDIPYFESKIVELSNCVFNML